MIIKDKNQKQAMIELAALYMEDNEKTGKVIPNENKTVPRPADSRILEALDELVSVIRSLSSDLKNDSLFLLAENALDKFVDEFTVNDYFSSIAKILSFVLSSPEYFPVLVLLDYIYSDDSYIIYGQLTDGEMSCVRFSGMIMGTGYKWSDYMLVCHYMGNADENNRTEKIMSYVRSLTGETIIGEINVLGYLNILSTSAALYRNAVGNKVPLINSSEQYPIPDIAKFIGNTYSQKEALVPVLIPFFKDLSESGRDLLANVKSGKVNNFKIGETEYSDIKINVSDDVTEISYRIKDIHRKFRISKDSFGGFYNYALYPDMLVTMAVFKGCGAYTSEEAAAIVRKFNLMYFRPIPLDTEALVDFLSLTE